MNVLSSNTHSMKSEYLHSTVQSAPYITDASFFPDHPYYRASLVSSNKRDRKASEKKAKMFSSQKKYDSNKWANISSPVFIREDKNKKQANELNERIDS
jgi:hypothetical protein